jgi:hypothetical protein
VKLGRVLLKLTSLLAVAGRLETKIFEVSIVATIGAILHGLKN